MTEDDTYNRLKYKVVVAADGVRRYYNEKDQLHRDDGPAIEYPDGSTFWYHNGYIHREDGPAIEWKSGKKSWYIHGTPMSEDTFERYLQFIKKV